MSLVNVGSRVWQRVVHSHLVQSLAHPGPGPVDFELQGDTLKSTPAGQVDRRAAEFMKYNIARQAEHDANCGSCAPKHRGYCDFG